MTKIIATKKPISKSLATATIDTKTGGAPLKSATAEAMPVAAKPKPIAASLKPATLTKKINVIPPVAKQVKNLAKPQVNAKSAVTVKEKEKIKKPKLIRDSFTMPELEYEAIGQVKKACLKAGFEIKKSELLRIGVALISQMDLANLKDVLATLPKLKTGRPKKG